MDVCAKSYLRKDGYRVLYLGIKDGKECYILEHRMVVEMLLGRKLKRTEIVHHKDGNRAHNSPSNLEVMTRAAHNRHHAVWEARRKRVDCACQWCGTVVSLPPSLAETNKYCGEECRLAALHEGLKVVRQSTPCEVCETMIIQGRYRKKYCSEACRAKGRGSSVSAARQAKKAS